MKNIKKWISILILLALMPFSVLSQHINQEGTIDNNLNKNTIRVSVSTFVLPSSANIYYERFFYQGSRFNFYGKVGYGGFVILGFGTIENYKTYTATVGCLLGEKDHYWDLSLGVIGFNPNSNNEDNFLLPDISVGYRFQTRLFIFGFGACFPKGVYATVGISI